ncbi:helix-turn-helix transcriptional regulator [Actinomadura sp. NPDC048955]|uniref:DNA-binding CsgD family transcriptional regulator n=1 Tax=Actinomadura luteofluorescens TaxID=46163 RepID=A0A7Y9ENR4_9ACTN|nr:MULTISPECIES: helix-turn-helix transcriptional regulator [Actinomadura]MCR3741991.1 regulatory protein, luxR family [Actinomadura glauciflava]NYD51153.1 DNA-binding CsgD family transcriptional regulator [Actinomadura luteofluorescens]
MHLSVHDQKQVVHLLATARHEILSLVPAWPAPLRNAYLRRRTTTRPRSRIVVSRSCRLQAATGQGPSEIRLGGTLPAFLLVVDRRTALVRRNGPYLAPAIVQPAEIDRLVALFESHWEQAFPIAPVQARPMSELQLNVLRKLAAGMTDQAAANALKISPRTVQRQVHDAMQQLGARSRLELGICLAATDLV